MTKSIARILSIPLFLAAPSVVAQTAAPTNPVTPLPQAAPTGSAELAAPAAAPPSPPAPSVSETEAEPAAPPPLTKEQELAEKVEALETKVAGLEETNTANQEAIAKASKLKFSGYVQGRYEWHQESANGATFKENTFAATATNTDRFMLRHAYFTAQYKGTNSEYQFQINANNKEGVAYKDIYAAFVDTWTPLKMKLSVGQFKYPFGYEMLQSDAEREMPERAAIQKFFFDGDRDRGVRLQGSYDYFNFQVALVNGTIYDGTKNLGASKDPGSPYPFGGNDPNQFKDWVGRLGVDFGSFVGGVSGYFGKGLYIAPPTATSAAIPDSRYKYRVGADVQGYIDVPGLGGLALKGEVMYGKDTARPYHGIAANPCKSSATWGFILTAVQNIAGDFGLVARFDGKDTLEGSIADGCKEKTAAESDRVLTVGGGLLYYASANVKATLTYEHPTEQGSHKKDNDFAMAQLQARF